MISRVILGWILLFETFAFAELQVPPINPAITGTFPHGGQRGREIEITLQGRNLQNTQSIHFKSPKLQATILSSDPYAVKARIRIAADTEVGRHDLRLIATHGSAIGYFDVSTFLESKELEPNNDAKRAQELRFPALVNGIVTQGDYDFYKFRVRSGQTITFDVLGTRNGSQADTAISILDERGEEIEYSDDYYGFKDPHIIHTFSRDGTYLLRLSGSGEIGCDTCDYRLYAGEMPFAELAMPAGARQGSTVEFILHGVNLADIKDVTLGDGLAKGTVISAKSTEARVRISVPKSAELGA